MRAATLAAEDFLPQEAPRMSSAAEVLARLEGLGDPGHAPVLQGYFRTGPGEYGGGDRFLGIRVPVLRTLAREYRGIALDEVSRLLRSPWHEARLLAVLLLADAYGRGDEQTREAIYRL